LRSLLEQLGACRTDDIETRNWNEIKKNEDIKL